ncbi:hypothetical protein FRACYDRAFT_195450 [Fragilariopsis cylindrus CCMP1102]|uniref:Uncharacterized protein n=1 Tax=Fragilariopsis cylindrus CCMP1102 TaxID=635003 RepID=A0A1E7ETV2_9STRA|nr:hypothetical protein FRACYDRAFT_195450 [Fragilariopsis cylindrus CCMP1102]|eukprot:OEU09286.1 hypothetical protein FRACYDRAFT_195450 [Fragilariopsis cylindrus CCMP1102]
MILLGSTDIIVTTSPVVDAFRTSSYQSSSRSNIPSSSFLLTPRGTTTIVKTRATTNNLLLLFSSIGDGDGGSGSSGGGRGSDDDNDLGDFLDPMKKPDSEGMKRARQYMSETSLPISFGDDGIEDTDDSTELSSSSSLVSSRGNATSSALFGGGGAGGSDNNGDDDDNNKSQQQITGPSPSLLAKNPYMQVVSKISPSDLIAKFTAESDPRVQEAVRTTILGLIGSLPKLAFETTSITTGQRLASLMFQLQMTGYMFKNAEYRLSMSQSLGMTQDISSNLLLSGSEKELLDKDDDPLVSGKIKGKLKIRYGKKKDDKDKATPTKPTNVADENDKVASSTSSSETAEDGGMEIEVDAAAYMSELRAEVSKLRDDLEETKETKDEALRKDLLLYIRTLPGQELKSLTNTMSQDVLVCMKGLVQAVLAGIGDGKIGPDTVTEQSGEAMAQLCMWQLAVGYNLRELEVREEMKKNLKSLTGDTTESGIDLSEPGTLE